jgi:hypothetical protein
MEIVSQLGERHREGSGTFKNVATHWELRIINGARTGIYKRLKN